MRRGTSVLAAVGTAVLAACSLTACATASARSAPRPPVVVHLALSTTRVPAGTPITGVVTLTNTTHKRIEVRACAADVWLQVGIERPGIPYRPIDPIVACPASVWLAPGAQSFPVHVSTSYLACTERSSVPSTASGEPRCGPRGTPPLPAGRYRTTVELIGLPVDTSFPGPRSVTLLPPVGVAWANEVFAEAPLPPGARPTTVAVPSLRGTLDSLGSQQADLHALYLVPGTRETVAAYLLAHLPRGAANNQGDEVQTDPVPDDAELIPLTMPTAGPNEYAATLLYTFAADGPGLQELRVDAQTSSVPDRPATELAAPTGTVVVTGYGQTSLSQGASHPVTVTLTGRRAAQFRAIFNRLGLARPASCMEYAPTYRVVLHTDGATPSIIVNGSFCAGDQVEADIAHGDGFALADHHCTFLAAVVRSLPTRGVAATRSALVACRELYVG